MNCKHLLTKLTVNYSYYIMYTTRISRARPEINSSSMADIAFLLLIFFLVTTTINVDTGIGMVLPPPPDDTESQIQKRNQMNILVNAEGKILMDEQLVQIDEVKNILKKFINNYGVDPELSVSPQNAVVSILTQSETPYRVYIDMLDEVMGTYNELRDEASMANYGVPFKSLEPTSDQREYITDMIPKRISLAESSDN